MAQQAKDMAALFGGDMSAPSFAAIPGLEREKLPVPRDTDTLPELAKKMVALRRVVERGQSLAVATGLAAAGHATTDPLEFAKGEMSISERDRYDAWMGGARLLNFDKQTSLEPVDKWTGNETSLLKWLSGLREMYADPTLQKGHVVWYAKHAPFMVPCIMAFVKVVTATKALTAPKSDLTPDELAEYQTAKKILAEASFRVQAIMNTLKEYTVEIDKGNRAVQTRIRYYEPRIKRNPKGEAPLNKERSRQGLPRLTGPSNLSHLGKRGTEAHREELGEGRQARRRRVAGPAGPSWAGPPETGDRGPSYQPESPPVYGTDEPLQDREGDVSMGSAAEGSATAALTAALGSAGQGGVI